MAEPGAVGGDLQIIMALSRVRRGAVRGCLPWGGVVHLACIESAMLSSELKYAHHVHLHDELPEHRLEALLPHSFLSGTVTLKSCYSCLEL